MSSFIYKSQLAIELFPDSPTKKAATDRLRRAINRNRLLLAALAQDGYNVRDYTFSPKQVRLIRFYLVE